ncbi:MAG TPA: DUF6600 domain-containing protein [Anaeromyxobacteraceae bacterium]|nr:DUF6600 domain-containing protein [Anaeromyxobacteraceae bacterium]
MKRIAISLALVLSAGCIVVPATPAPPPGAADVDPFEHSLAPYGQWLVLAPYGRIWRPTRVSAGWRPYLHGYWVWTDDGWFWTSEEPWGWATYHYGRWVLDATLGWVWVPGYDWAPAWVAWRWGGGYVGWAPLLPGIDVWWVDPYPLDAAWWCFVPVDRFVGVRVDRVVVPPPLARPIFPRTRPAPPRAIAELAPPRGGPPRIDVEREVRRPIVPHRMVPVPTPDRARGAPGRDSVPVYRTPPPQRAQPAPEREAPPPPHR